MATRKPRVKQAEVVKLFGNRLREIRLSRGMTQIELARQAQVTVAYIWRLESGGSAAGIDLVDRLAKALGTTIADLFADSPVADTKTVLREQATRLFNTLLESSDVDDLLMLNPLLARLIRS